MAVRVWLRNVVPHHDAGRVTTSITLPTTSKPKETNEAVNGSYYPRWKSSNGIPLHPVATYIEHLLEERQNLFVQQDHTSFLFPETPYIVDAKGVSSSKSIVWGRVFRIQREDRWVPSHRLFNKAWNILQQAEQGHRWATLRKVVFEEGGFPFVVWFGDNLKCNVNNWQLPDGKNTSVSLPIFTTCALAASAHCDYSFPFPTYKVFRDAKNTTQQWYDHAAVQTAEYPWESKIRQVVWRGSLYWKAYETTVTSTRYHLLRRVTELHNVQGENNTLFDVQATAVENEQVANRTDLIGNITYACDFREFQKFVAVLDVDGLSWSSRFASLLCHNSVVLKVEPEFVDYFHYDVQPWKHYIPVRSDLSNLDEIAAYVTDPRNDDTIREIIRTANGYCHTHMLESKIAEDMLDIWEAYVDGLYKNDQNWTKKWQTVKSGIEDKMNLLL